MDSTTIALKALLLFWGKRYIKSKWIRLDLLSVGYWGGLIKLYKKLLTQYYQIWLIFLCWAPTFNQQAHLRHGYLLFIKISCHFFSLLTNTFFSPQWRFGLVMNIILFRFLQLRAVTSMWWPYWLTNASWRTYRIKWKWECKCKYVHRKELVYWKHPLDAAGFQMNQTIKVSSNPRKHLNLKA